MESHNISKSCGIISHIRNTPDIKYEKIIYYSLIHPYLTYCVNVWSSNYWTNSKPYVQPQKRSVHTLFATVQQPHSRDVFSNQKILPLDKLINQQEGILADKVFNGPYLLNDFLKHGDVRHKIHLTKSTQINWKQLKKFNECRKKSKRNESYCCYQEKPKIFLQICKNNSTVRAGIGPLRGWRGDLEPSNKKISELLNEQCNCVFSTPDPAMTIKYPITFLDTHKENTMSDFNITREDIIDAI